VPTNDCHCHFFSDHFFAKLGEQAGGRSAADVVTTLGWNPPGTPDELADRWVEELDRHGIARAALIASIPGDEESVARAVARHQSRFVGFAMIDPTAADAVSRVDRYLRDRAIRCLCLFPAMQRYSLRDARARAVFDLAARNPGTAVFVHCGALSVGVRRKLGLASRFDVSYGNPLDVQAAAAEFSQVPFIIPHFGAGLFREALLAADLCPNVFLDTSSSNKWMAYHPGLTLDEVFRRAVVVAGAERLLFGTDSSFFPRGWNKTVHEAQAAALV
jgi:predicted TIM-barrel fold metal-dependent hydrolase